jgi:CubicO group peptidase (beta-lactamase class C family)
MARTYYSQLLHDYRWNDIVKAMDVIVDQYRNFPQPDGMEIRIFGISVWAGQTGYTDEGEFEVTHYLGSVMSIYPSGKFYMHWTTNQTNDDVRRDQAFQAAIEKIEKKFNIYFDNGEGDPTDVFVKRSYN